MTLYYTICTQRWRILLTVLTAVILTDLPNPTLASTQQTQRTKTSESYETPITKHNYEATKLNEIHDVIELFEEGKIYPVLNEDEIDEYVTFTRVMDESTTNTIESIIMNDMNTTNESENGMKETFLKAESIIKDNKEQKIIDSSGMNSENDPFNVETVSTKSDLETSETGTYKSPNKDEFNINTNLDYQEASSKTKFYDDLIKEYTSVRNEKKIRKERVDETINVDRFTKNEQSKMNDDSLRTFKKREASTKRTKTGDTILNIRGAVRDSIGDASAPGAIRDSTHLDTVVIHPSQFLKDSDIVNFTQSASKELSTQPSNAATSNRTSDMNVLAEPRSRVSIPCDLPENFTILHWSKDGQVMPLGAEGSGRAWWWGDAGSVVIGRVVRDDAGLWQCTGEGQDRKRMKSNGRRLLVYEDSRAPFLQLDGRRLDPGNTWIPVREGVTLEVLCLVEGGVPNPTITWSIRGTVEDDHLVKYTQVARDNSSVEGVTTSRIRVFVQRVHHNASLQCQSTQPTSTGPSIIKHASLKLDVTYPPSFVISRWPGFGVSLREGSPAALRCDVDSHPPSAPVWRTEHTATQDTPTSVPTSEDEDGTSTSHTTLRWNILTPQNAGWYRCIAQWQGTRYSSIGYFLNIKPSTEDTQVTTGSDTSTAATSEQHLNVQYGGNVQLNCPKGSVGCWSKKTSDLWSPVGSRHAHGVLGIRGVLYQEAGEYRCIGASTTSQNKLQELRRVTLHVTGQPSITPVSTVYGNITALVCNVNTMRWIVDATVLRPGYENDIARATEPEQTNDSDICVTVTLITQESFAGEIWLICEGRKGPDGQAGAGAVWHPTALTPPPRALASGSDFIYASLTLLIASVSFIALVGLK